MMNTALGGKVLSRPSTPGAYTHASVRLFLGLVGPRFGASGLGARAVGVSTLPHRRLTAELGWVVKSSRPPDSQAAARLVLTAWRSEADLSTGNLACSIPRARCLSFCSTCCQISWFLPKSAQVSGAPRQCAASRASALSGAVLQ